jgi:hypothetical protein
VNQRGIANPHWFPSTTPEQRPASPSRALLFRLDGPLQLRLDRLHVKPHAPADFILGDFSSLRQAVHRIAVNAQQVRQHVGGHQALGLNDHHFPPSVASLWLNTTLYGRYPRVSRISFARVPAFWLDKASSQPIDLLTSGRTPSVSSKGANCGDLAREIGAMTPPKRFKCIFCGGTICQRSQA